MNTVHLPLLKACIGWTPDTWARPLTKFLQESDTPQPRSALEIGAAVMSSLSPFLAQISGEVICSYYDPSTYEAIKDRNDRIVNQFLTSEKTRNICYEQTDITNLPDRQWDLIITKSILGGIFRENNSTLSDVIGLVNKIRQENLTHSGQLILIENGKSVLEPLLRHFGARKNQWRFFDKNSFPEAIYHDSFGVLSAFSFRSRLPRVGPVLEKALFWADIPLSKISTDHTVHLWVFNSLNLSPND